MGTTLPVIAGMVSTTVFACSALPMLVKAARTRDLSSYSVGNLVLANAGNGIHSIYVFHLPLGPIWFLHSFYLLTSALMLFWWVRYHHGPLKGVQTAATWPLPALLCTVGYSGRKGGCSNCSGGGSGTVRRWTDADARSSVR
jgi:uncharacterized protein with PQ loop repeat